MSSIGVITLDDIGEVTSPASISVDDSGAVSYSIAAGKKHVSFQNTGSKIAWYGGSNVDPSNKRGNKVFPNQTLVYRNVKNSFQIYFKCASSNSSTISVVENA